jgi:hypothetical protein
MHSACDQVEEGTVLNSAHFFYAHPSISSATVKSESIRLKSRLLLGDSTPPVLRDHCGRGASRSSARRARYYVVYPQGYQDHKQIRTCEYERGS